jgi:hypothetical protein
MDESVSGVTMPRAMDRKFYKRGKPLRRPVRRTFYPKESRVFCPCELCRLRFGRLLYPRTGGEPLGMGQRWKRRVT